MMPRHKKRGRPGAEAPDLSLLLQLLYDLLD